MAERFLGSPASSAEPTFVAANRLAAAQWEAFLVDRATPRPTAWSGPLVATYAGWTASLWDALDHTALPGLLTARQSAALWQRVVAESPEGEHLLGAAVAARFAEEAWRCAVSRRIPLEDLSAARQPGDFAAFLGWSREYRARLADSSWIDAALLDDALAAAGVVPSGPIVLADLELAPSAEHLVDRLRAAGAFITAEAPPPVAGRAVRLRCADPRAELDAAADWAVRRLEARPGARIAIVVPGLDAASAAATRRALLARLADVADGGATVGGVEAGAAMRVAEDQTAIGEAEERAAQRGAAVGRPGTADGSRAFVPAADAERVFVAGVDAGVDARPLIGAALNALELLSPRGGAVELGRWLRSPFFHGPDAAARAAAAALEASLRGAPAARLPFVDAWRRAGLRERARTAAPDIALRIDAALAELDAAGPRPTPAGWVALWSSVLERLGWRGWPEDDEALEGRRWEDASQELAQLTPIVGPIDAERALAELEAGLAAPPAVSLPLDGVHVLASVEDVGPGYAGVWVTGATDTAYPGAVRLNPLLPRRLQIERRVPWSSPGDALARSRALLARLVARAPEVVFSSPARIRDEAAEPSPLLRGLPEWPVVERGGDATRRAAADHVGSRKGRRPPPADADASKALTAGGDPEAGSPPEAP